MAFVAVTYTWVVEVDDPEDEEAIESAVEEYVHSVNDAFSDPVKTEVLGD